MFIILCGQQANQRNLFRRLGAKLLVARQPAPVTTTTLLCRRPFFSFLTGNVALKEETNDTKAARVQQRDAKQNCALTRISMQHAHINGPWAAMLVAVISHHAAWALTEKQHDCATGTPHTTYNVLDLACGPRGQPGTKIAHELINATVHCTDSCSQFVADVPTSITSTTDNRDIRMQPPPCNLTKSVVDLSDLSAFPSNTFNVVTCCYGYTSVDADVLSHAVAEAHRVLKPGGILVVANWERSAMNDIGRDVMAFVRGGGIDPSDDNDAEFLFHPATAALALSRAGEFEAILVGAGFDKKGGVVTSFSTYPFDLGSCSEDQFATGTVLIRDELESFDAQGSDYNLGEEAFWRHIGKYTDTLKGAMMLRENTFQLTVSTKSVM